MPAAVAEPLLTPEDFAGLVIRTASSDIQVEGLQAMGAEPTTEGHPADGEGVDAVETMWWTYQEQSQYEYAPFVTGNAILWPKTVVLFANADTLAGLDDDERGWVIDAAADAVAWSAEHADDAEAGHMAAACERITRIATATEEQLTALREATEPVYEAMRADDALAATLARIEELVADAPATPSAAVPAGCEYTPGDENRPPPTAPAVDAEPGDSGDLPLGTYRYAVTVEELRNAGLSAGDAEYNAGVFTWTLAEGEWSYEHVPEVPEAVGDNLSCSGVYDVQGDRATFVTTEQVDGGDCFPPSWSARWSAGDDMLIWSEVTLNEFSIMFHGGGWQRID
jgi:hypothetical protein